MAERGAATEMNSLVTVPDGRQHPERMGMFSRNWYVLNQQPLYAERHVDSSLNCKDTKCPPFTS